MRSTSSTASTRSRSNRRYISWSGQRTSCASCVSWLPDRPAMIPSASVTDGGSAARIVRTSAHSRREAPSVTPRTRASRTMDCGPCRFARSSRRRAIDAQRRPQQNRYCAVECDRHHIQRHRPAATRSSGPPGHCTVSGSDEASTGKTIEAVAPACFTRSPLPHRDQRATRGAIKLRASPQPRPCKRSTRVHDLPTTRAKRR